MSATATAAAVEPAWAARLPRWSDVTAWLAADRPRAALIAVCVLHALSPVVLIGVHLWFGWDETTYISQISAHAPAGTWSAPRARGTALLVTPVSALTGSVVAIRLYLAALSGIGLLISFRPWLRLLPGYVAPLAALLMSSLWISIFYGYAAMPNQYVAFGALTAVGYVLLPRRLPEHARRYAVYTVLAVAVTALVRPTDATFLAAALVVAALLGLSGPHRRLLILAVVLGLAVGWSEWVIEAIVTFGGISARFHAASAENTGGVHFALGAQMDTLAGPPLCRGTCRVSPAVIDRLWWLALAPLTALGAAAGRRVGTVTEVGVAALAGLALAAQYIFFIDYSAPRFLLPTYALLAIPCAQGLIWATSAIPAPRPVVLGGAAALLAAHLAIQVDILEADVVPSGSRPLQMASWLKEQGVRPRCLVVGTEGAPVAYALGCYSPPQSPSGVQQILARGDTTVAVINRGPAPRGAFFAHWTRTKIVEPLVPPRWRVFVHLAAHPRRP